MKISVLKESQNEIELQISDLTIVEVLRIYLNKDENVEFAAWKRNHPSEPAIINIKTKGKSAKKALQDAISQIEKESTKLLGELKNIK
jgi:DNA-directed RNA polymerase subunit L